jgi:hypothetical protein
MIRGKVKNRLGRMARGATNKAQATVRETHGPSPNPATNVLIAEILVRSAGRLFRRSMEKGLLKARFEREQAVAIIEGRGLAHTLISTTVARVATRSVPGALLVGGGLLAKTLFDRSISRRKARRRGNRQLAEQASHEDDIL